MHFGSILAPFLAPKLGPKMDPGHPWGTGSPQKRAQEPEDPQKASKMEPKLSPGPSKSSLWATISLPKCSQNGSRPQMGHMEPTEACPEAPEAPNDSQHGAKTHSMHLSINFRLALHSYVCLCFPSATLVTMSTICKRNDVRNFHDK